MTQFRIPTRMDSRNERVSIANERREWPSQPTLDSDSGSDLTQNLFPSILHLVAAFDPV